jgi:hypothetical protein
LLKRGLDPNESDNNGRTALVNVNFDFWSSFVYCLFS